jgi:hypothetical protein
MYMVGESDGFFKFEVTIEEKTALDLESDAHTQCEMRLNKRVEQLCSFKTPLFFQILKKNLPHCVESYNLFSC